MHSQEYGNKHPLYKLLVLLKQHKTTFVNYTIIPSPNLFIRTVPQQPLSEFLEEGKYRPILPEVIF